MITEWLVSFNLSEGFTDEGTDTLTSIEKIQFTDQTIDQVLSIILMTAFIQEKELFLEITIQLKCLVTMKKRYMQKVLVMHLW